MTTPQNGKKPGMSSIINRILLFMSIVLFLTCSKSTHEDLSIPRTDFKNYLTANMDSCNIAFGAGNVLEITEKCNGWNEWRIELDSIEFISRKTNSMFVAKNYTHINSAIKKTWTPSLPDSLRGMGNSVTDPESTYTPACNNHLTADSIVHFLNLLLSSKKK